MTKKRGLKTTSLETVKDEFIGKVGTPKRDQYELALKLELGELIGVQKAQISKLENGASNVTIGTIVKLFDALKAKIALMIEVEDQKVEII